MSLQARCSVAVKMFILGFNLSRRQSFSVDSSTRKAIRYWSVESAMAVSEKLANLRTRQRGHETWNVIKVIKPKIFLKSGL